MIKALNHIGISVVDIERSIAFYRQAFGMELQSRGAFEATTEAGRYGTILGLPGAQGKSAMLKGPAFRIELFEFAHPEPRRNNGHEPVSDHGISHFCIDVADIEAEYERLKTLGATFHCPPLTFFGKVRATYVRDPDGNVFEMVESLSG